MQADIVNLHHFYQTPLGQTAQRMINDKLSKLWPAVRNEDILGFGYTNPFLPTFEGNDNRILSFMSCGQGAIPWPHPGPSRVALVDPYALPLPDRSISRCLIVHGLEGCIDPAQFLREIWRVLADGGRLLVLAPNRRGLWARSMVTPFGWGQPYTGRQLFEVATQSWFSPFKPLYSLYVPPSLNPTLISLAPSFERFGQRYTKKLGGVVILEAQKLVYCGRKVGLKKNWSPQIFIPPVPATGA
ncbi:MAG: class I SAM-dependent methyltransferase [Holosporales bacterium]